MDEQNKRAASPHRRVKIKPNHAQRKRMEAEERSAQKRANAKLRKLVLSEYHKVDEALKKGMPKDITCRRGCAHCCRQMPSVTLAEAANIVITHPRRVLAVQGMLEKYDAQLEGLDEGREMPTEHAEQIARTHELAAAWFRTNQQCAFLSPLHNECTIYSDRPNACRVYLVNTPVELCASEDPNQEVGLWNPPIRDQSSIDMLQLNAKLLKGDVIVGPLPSVVLIAARMLGLTKEQGTP